MVAVIGRAFIALVLAALTACGSDQPKAFPAEGDPPPSGVGCGLAVKDCDLGSVLCPPEPTKEEREECERENVAFFVARRGAWKLITYEERGDCDTVQSLEPSFPDAVCET